MMHRFYARPENFSDRNVTLDIDETRHLRDVLRLKSGEAINVFDGIGREYACRIASISKTAAELLIDRAVAASSPESGLDLTLAVAMLKGEKFDLVIQKSVELGVRRLVPIRTVRTNVRSRDSAARVLRWRKIALEASKQSGRAFLTVVENPIDFGIFLSAVDGNQTVLFSERDGESLPPKLEGKKLTAIVGPEGGWDDVELAAARSSGCRIVTLGGRTLRAETAAIAITAVLQNRFGDLN
jgi:16S rRNA (uracil1498-N3)-methyltransferase